MPEPQCHHLRATVAVGAHAGVEVDEAIEVRPVAGVARGRKIVQRFAIARNRRNRDRAGLDEAPHATGDGLLDQVARRFVKALALQRRVIPHRRPGAGVTDHVDALDHCAAIRGIEQVAFPHFAGEAGRQLPAVATGGHRRHGRLRLQGREEVAAQKARGAGDQYPNLVTGRHRAARQEMK
jgi:hypothetical protein